VPALVVPPPNQRRSSFPPIAISIYFRNPNRVRGPVEDNELAPLLIEGSHMHLRYFGGGQQKLALITMGLSAALLTEGCRFESYLRSQTNRPALSLTSPGESFVSFHTSRPYIAAEGARLSPRQRKPVSPFACNRFIHR
jgi:hypothetical protein